METTLIIMAAGIGSRFGGGIKQLAPVGPSGEIIMDYSKYKAVPFWSWNDRLEKTELINQVKWMKENGFGGYFMHARSGLKTEYLDDEWFDCIETSVDEGDKLGLKSWAYDENGWPSGFVGGKLLENPENCDKYLTYTIG